MTIKRKNEIIQILLNYIEEQANDSNVFYEILESLGIAIEEIHDV